MISQKNPIASTILIVIGALLVVNNAALSAEPQSNFLEIVVQEELEPSALTFFSRDGKSMVTTGVINSGKESKKRETYSNDFKSTVPLQTSPRQNVIIWDIEQGVKRYAYNGGNSIIYSKSSSQRGEMGGFRNSKPIWLEPTSNIAVSPDIKYVLFADLVSNDLVFTGLHDSKELWRTRPYEGGVLPSYISMSNDARYGLTIDIDSTTLKVWDLSTGHEIKALNIKSRGVSSAYITPDNKYVLLRIFPYHMSLWEIETGKELWTTNMDGSINSVAFTPDGKYVLSGGQSLDLLEISTGRKSKILFPSLIASDEGGSVQIVVVSADGKIAVASHRKMYGFKDTISFYNISTGKKIKSFSGFHSKISSLSLSPNGKLLLVGQQDGTTNVLSFETGGKLAQFYVFDDGEWVILAENGYFNASMNGAKHLKVSVRNLLLPLDRFYDKYYNPGLVSLLLTGRKSKDFFQIKKIEIAPPPIVRIVSPEPNASFNIDIVQITVTAEDVGGGIDEIRLYHNEKALGENENVKSVPIKNGVKKTYTVNLVDGPNNFSAVGFSRDRTASVPIERTLVLTAAKKNVSLHVLVVGINKYKNSSLNLSYSEQDARAVVGIFQKKWGSFYKSIHIEEIYN